MPDRGTILVVDDDQLTCELVQGALAAEGFHVFIARPGRRPWPSSASMPRRSGLSS